MARKVSEVVEYCNTIRNSLLHAGTPVGIIKRAAPTSSEADPDGGA
jgi:hypothetical protein